MKALPRFRFMSVLAFALLVAAPAFPQGFSVFQASDLIRSTQYYTETNGGGLGTPIKMSGGDNIGSERSNDGYYGPIKLGFTIKFFGKSYTELWANVNGNITFEAGSSAALPPTPPGMSVFFADADTRPTTSGVMWLRQEAKRTIITWDNVGYFNSHADKRNSFQLVLNAPDAVPAGEGQIGFFFKDMGWDVGDAQGGNGGFGGPPPAATSAAVGLGDGVANGFVLWGSTYPGISQTVANHHVWFNVDAGGIPKLAQVDIFVPVAAHTAGAAGSIWATDLVVHNTGMVAAPYTISLLPSAADNSAVVPLENFSVDPGQSSGTIDIIASKLGNSNWRGAMIVSSMSRDLRVTTRTYNTGVSGTYGQTVQGSPATAALPAGTKGYLLGLSQNAELRTNVGFLNPAKTSVSVEAKLFSPAGTELGKLTWTIAPLGHIQEDQVFTKVSSSSVTYGRIEVTATGPVFAYASLIDQRTGAPTYVTPMR